MHLLPDFGLHDAGWADGLATIRLDTRQYLEFGIYRNHLAHRRGDCNGLGLLLLGHARIVVLR